MKWYQYSIAQLKIISVLNLGHSKGERFPRVLLDSEQNERSISFIMMFLVTYFSGDTF